MRLVIDILDGEPTLVTNESGPPAWRKVYAAPLVSHPLPPVMRRTMADMYEPLRDDQRVALFAAFNSVFGTNDAKARWLFTRVLLGKGPDEGASWSRPGHHTTNSITAAEASVLLSALDAFERVESL